MRSDESRREPHLRSLAEFAFECPALPEQRAIGAVLGALDDKIKVNSEIDRTTDAYLSALLRHGLQSGDYETVNLGDIADVNAVSTKPQLGNRLRYVDNASVGTGRFEYLKQADGSLRQLERED